MRQEIRTIVEKASGVVDKTLTGRMAIPAVTTNVARQVLQTRALQCSFSSVFHLRRAGMNAKDADNVENLFIITVGVPLVIIGITGACCYVTNTIGTPSWTSSPRLVAVEDTNR